MNFAVWIPTAINIAVLALIIFGRKWIEANIEKRVQHNFDVKLATINSALRARETEISNLRETLLSGRTQRQALLDKRRLEAVERIWEALGKLAPFVLTSASMSAINFDIAATRAPNEKNLQKFFETIADQKMFEKQFGDQEKPAFAEQPFVSPLAWAYFSAYQSIVMLAFAKARLLAIGTGDAAKFIKRDHIKSLLKQALPNRADFIDANDPSAFHHLLDELRDLLLAELKKMLEGTELDNAELAQAKRISDEINKIENDRAEAAAAIANTKTEPAG